MDTPIPPSDPGIPPEIVGFRRELLRRALSRNELFGGLEPEVLDEIEQELVLLSYPSGTTLIRQGDTGDCLYVIVSGRVQVLVGPRGHERVIDELAAGHAFGEMAVLTGEPRRATIRAIRDTQAARLTEAAFDRLVQKRPREILRACSRTLVDRFSGQFARSVQQRTRLSTIAVLPLHGGVPLDDVCQRLTASLATLNRTTWLSRAQVARALDRPDFSEGDDADADGARLAAWLSEQEFAARYCVYQCDSSFTRWTTRCLRQADHLLLVAYADRQSEVTSIEPELAAAGYSVARHQRSLLLLQRDEATIPSGTRGWLSTVEVQRHFHVRASMPPDYQRVARLLTGNAVGLVLGGGGARGFAHLGVIRALRDAGIPIDAVGGTSAGALFGAQIALGWDNDTMQRKTAAVVRSLIDRTLPLVSLATGRRFARALQDAFGDCLIEDLWLPLFTISSNLTRAEVKVHDRGLLWFGVLASNNAPVVYPPLVSGGDLHVDGSLLNNVPVDVMSRQLQGGTVIAVDLTPPVDLESTPYYGLGLSGWKVLYRKLNPFGAPIQVPSMMNLLGRAATLGSVAHQRPLISELADLVLRPPIREFAVTDHHLGDQIAELGYHYAREQLANWRLPKRDE
jgi:NTE family protein